MIKRKQAEPGDGDLGCCPKCESKEYWVLDGIQQFNPSGCSQSVVIEIAGQLKTFIMLVCAFCRDEKDLDPLPWYRERVACRCTLCSFEWDWMDDSIRKCDRGNEL